MAISSGNATANASPGADEECGQKLTMPWQNQTYTVGTTLAVVHAVGFHDFAGTHAKPYHVPPGG